MIDLAEIATALMAPKKGLFAADESVASADKRLAAHGEATGALSRWEFRDLFLLTPGIEEYLSGTILFEETLFQSGDDEIAFSKHLADRGILVGIKVDQGTEPFPESPKELITNGLVGLPERLAEYRDKHAARFTKWRAVITIDGDALPTAAAIVENTKRLAHYARAAQEAGLVPILEPEVLYDGKHSRMRSREVITQTLHALMRSLDENVVALDGVIIKTAMALSGKDTKKMDAPEEVAEDTLAALTEAIPRGVPGIVFLSGGQTPDQAIANMAAISQLAKHKHAPWPLTYSFSRAFQDDALQIWQGKEENVPAARAAFLARLKQASDALA